MDNKKWDMLLRVTSPGWLIGAVAVNLVLMVASGLISVALCIGKAVTNKKTREGADND